MRNSALLAIFLLLLSACNGAAPPQPTSLPLTPTATADPQPAPNQEEPHRSVFLISWDGARADIVYRLMDDGALPNFAALADQGLRAEYAQSIDPPLTAAAQNSIATGSYPAHTGLVSNSYHNPTDSIYWYRRGFDELLDQAEPVWVTASKAGLTTASVFFTGGSPSHPGQTADYTIGYGVRDAYSNQITISLEPVVETWEGSPPTSYSAPFEGSYNIREVARVFLYVYDSSDDNQANYDQVILTTDRIITPDTVNLRVGEWGQFVLQPHVLSGADFLIQTIQQDETSLAVTLFQSGVYHNSASPRVLLARLNEKFGYFPCGPDYYALESGWITPEDNLYLLERSAIWMAEVAAWVFTSYQPDLIFTWQDGFDSAGHAFLMTNARQLNYSPQNETRYNEYFRRAALIADRALGLMLQAVDLSHTTMFLAADHGMAPIHSVVYVNTILEQAELLKLNWRNYVVIDESKAVAFASGGAANVYINLAGHEKDGIVPQDEYESVQNQIVETFTSLVDPQSGEAVFQRVLRQDELAQLHLDHINSGDVFVQAHPGYHLDHWRGYDNIFEAADFYGQHGYDSRLPEMHAIFIAAGAGISGNGQTIPPVKIVDYAPTIAALLGFPPAASVDGEPIRELLLP